MPETKMTYRVPYADTDQMGVVYYANYLIFFERVRNEFFRELEFSYSRLESEGVMLPVVEAHCDYKAPAFYDDELIFTVKVGYLKGCRVRMENQVFNQHNQLICQGYTVHAFMNSCTRKPVAAPKILVELLKKHGKIE